MKSSWVMVPLLFPFFTTLALGAPDVQSDRQTIQYHGIRASDPAGKEGLRNPERGFRYETKIAESNDDIWVARVEREENGTLTLVQCYCYLPQFVGTDISQQKLDQLRPALTCFVATA